MTTYDETIVQQALDVKSKLRAICKQFDQEKNERISEDLFFIISSKIFDIRFSKKYKTLIKREFVDAFGLNYEEIIKRMSVSLNAPFALAPQHGDLKWIIIDYDLYPKSSSISSAAKTASTTISKTPSVLSIKTIDGPLSDNRHSCVSPCIHSFKNLQTPRHMNFSKDLLKKKLAKAQNTPRKGGQDYPLSGVNGRNKNNGLEDENVVGDLIKCRTLDGIDQKKRNTILTFHALSIRPLASANTTPTQFSNRKDAILFEGNGRINAPLVRPQSAQIKQTLMKYSNMRLKVKSSQGRRVHPAELQNEESSNTEPTLNNKSLSALVSASQSPNQEKKSTITPPSREKERFGSPFLGKRPVSRTGKTTFDSKTNTRNNEDIQIIIDQGFEEKKQKFPKIQSPLMRSKTYESKEFKEPLKEEKPISNRNKEPNYSRNGQNIKKSIPPTNISRPISSYQKPQTPAEIETRARTPSPNSLIRSTSPPPKYRYAYSNACRNRNPRIDNFMKELLKITTRESHLITHKEKQQAKTEKTKEIPKNIQANVNTTINFAKSYQINRPCYTPHAPKGDDPTKSNRNNNNFKSAKNICAQVSIRQKKLAQSTTTISKKSIIYNATYQTRNKSPQKFQNMQAIKVPIKEIKINTNSYPTRKSAIDGMKSFKMMQSPRTQKAMSLKKKTYLKRKSKKTKLL